MNIAHYIISFTIYTLAMSGLIALALLVYKKVTHISSTNKKAKILSIEETMSINPRKTLLIVKAGDERFLIASDVDKTTLISKLEQNESIGQMPEINQTTQLQTTPVVDLEKVKSTIDNRNVDVLFPQKMLQEKKQNTPFVKPSVQKTKKPVHLEVISDKNLKVSEIRKQRSYMQTKRRNVNIEVGKVKNHGFSTIKEMVHKVNEL